ncbi:MAG: alanyl-tRNA editing protein [Pseudomonadota bacterium]
MTERLFYADPYDERCTATVTGITDQGGIMLDRTVFYPTGGGQPGDCGTFTTAGGDTLLIATTVTDRETGDIVHVPEGGLELPSIGDSVACAIDTKLRRAHMRCHTALHLLCSVIAFPVTGGQVSADKGRLDFDIPSAEALDKDALAAELNALVARDLPVMSETITDADLDANPELVRTMSVQPPRGSGVIRMIRIGDVDYQPCGGTHVRATGEIGQIALGKIEKKGAQNRRVRITITPPA